ncbi:MAG TPA: methyltransferase domain-containing protein [Caldilineaceae bacterium]|nr:methyltransferase domain-containing protein [Caldilineaceae bacterium]
MSTQPNQGRMAGRHWDPNQYLKFEDHRLRPALELLDRIPLTDPNVIYDIGCGTGQITRLLAERWPDAKVYGLDNSPEMLAKAGAEPSPVEWVEADIQQWSPEGSPDLIYSNATLQWVTDHEQLFPRLVRFLQPGGVLAVQMPLSWSMPSHILMRETLANGGVDGGTLGTEELRQAVGRKWVEDAGDYYDLLEGICTNVDIWETEYLQILSGDDPVLEWVKATGLRPILNGLGDEERAQFVSEYRQRLRTPYPVRANGHTLYPFQRLFIVATV